MRHEYYIDGEKIVTKQEMDENEREIYLKGNRGLRPYLRMLDGDMPQNPIDQMAWLLFNGGGCGFCKVCRYKPCNIKKHGTCVDNIANYIRECVHTEDLEKEDHNQLINKEIEYYQNKISILEAAKS